MKLCVAYMLMLVGAALAGPAPDISSLEITHCNCNRCLFTQIGYELNGRRIRVAFQGQQIRDDCSTSYITNSARVVIGWNWYCPIGGSDNGIFEVSYGHRYDWARISGC